MNQTKTLFLILTFLMAGSVFSAKKKSIKSLKDSLTRQSSDVAKVGATIKSIEKKISSSNEDYIQKTKLLKAIDQKVIALKDELSQSALDISTNFKETKRVLHHYLLDTIDENNQDELLKHKIYVRVLHKKIKKLNKAQIDSQQLLSLINDYEEKLKQARVNEELLYNLIVNLEDKKKKLGSDYISKMEKKNDLEEQLELALARRKVKKKTHKKVARSNVKIGLSFSNPLDSFISRKGSNKGVTYKYNKVSPIKSTQKGQVVYAGELASYGKVIMIDHGKEVRSVILGDINIKVKKGDLISKSAVLGYANVDPGLTKSLYYEIRKKNKVQNTLKLLKTKKI